MHCTLTCSCSRCHDGTAATFATSTAAGFGSRVREHILRRRALANDDAIFPLTLQPRPRGGRGRRLRRGLRGLLGDDLLGRVVEERVQGELQEHALA